MKTYIVDSFTHEQFKGNPAGVCFPENDISEVSMQHIAKELGLSETAFLQENGKRDSYSIRYFSPKMEIPLCGHATLASAKVLFKDNRCRKNSFYYDRKFGSDSRKAWRRYYHGIPGI